MENPGQTYYGSEAELPCTTFAVAGAELARAMPIVARAEFNFGGRACGSELACRLHSPCSVFILRWCTFRSGAISEVPLFLY